ncbi:MAG: TolC family protein [Acidobacteria bacterium]|nr:TolC family protein [Acidobacteriota bacterium]
MAVRQLLVGVCVCAAAVQSVFAQEPALTVDQAVNEAIDHNLALVAERYNLRVAEAAVITAGLRPNPVLTVGVFKPQGTLQGQGLSTQDESVRGDYLFERGGKRRLRVESADAARSVTELQLQDTIRRLRLDVELACTEVQLAQENVQLARDNLAAFTGVVDVNRERVRAGDLAEVEFQRSRLASIQFQNDVKQQEAHLQTARARLAQLLARAAGAPLPSIAGEMRHDAAALDIDALRQKADAARPDLLAARRDQARSVAETRLQLANGKVDLTVSGEYHRQLAAGVDGGAAAAFVSVPLPLFSRNQGEIARARQQQQQADARARALSSAVSTEVVTAYTDYTTNRDIVASIERDMLQQASDVRSATEYSYRRGEASFVEFLDAVRAFNETMQSYHAAQADYARSLYTLESLAGEVRP